MGLEGLEVMAETNVHCVCDIYHVAAMWVMIRSVLESWRCHIETWETSQRYASLAHSTIHERGKSSSVEIKIIKILVSPRLKLRRT